MSREQKSDAGDEVVAVEAAATRDFIPDEEFDRLFPEHGKLRKLGIKPSAVFEFAKWIAARGWYICEANEGPMHSVVFEPVKAELNDMLARHFEIDLDKLGAEKPALLAEVQKRLAAREP